MNVFSRKQPANLLQNALQKRKRLLFADAINPGQNSPVGAILPAKTTVLGIGRQRRTRVPGHFDFRHNRDMSPRGVSDDFPDVFLAVIAAVASVGPVSSTRFSLQPQPNVFAPSPYLNQARKFFAL